MKKIVYLFLIISLNLFSQDCDAQKLKESLINSKEIQLSWEEVHLKAKECYQNENVINILGEYWFQFGINNKLPIHYNDNKQNTNIDSKEIRTENNLTKEEIENYNLTMTGCKSSNNEEGCKTPDVPLNIPIETQTRFPKLTQDIIASPNMENRERNYWLQVLPVMTEEQVQELKDIIDTEQKKLAEIERKYSSKSRLAPKKKYIKEIKSKDIKEYFPKYINKIQIKEKIDNTQLIIPDETKNKYPKLTQDIIASPSMENKERNYWLQVLPIMTKDNINELIDILTKEQKRYNSNNIKLFIKKLIRLHEEPSKNSHHTCFVIEDSNITIVEASSKKNWVYAKDNKSCEGYLNLQDINITNTQEIISFLSYEVGDTVLSLLKKEDVNFFTDSIKISIARAYILDNQPNKCIKILQKVYDENNNNLEVLPLFATAYSQINKLDKSIFYQQKLLNVNSQINDRYKLNVYLYLNKESNFTKNIKYKNIINSLFYKIYTLQLSYEKSKESSKAIKDSLYKTLLNDSFSTWYQQYILALLSKQDPTALLPEEYKPKNGGIYSKIYWASGIFSINDNNNFAKNMLLKAKKYSTKRGRGRIIIEKLLIEKALLSLISGDTTIKTDSKLCPKEYDSCHAILLSATKQWMQPTNKLYNILLTKNFKVTKIQKYKNNISSIYEEIQRSIPLKKKEKNLLIVYTSTPIIKDNENLMFCLLPNKNIPTILANKVCISSKILFNKLNSKNIDYRIIIENEVGNKDINLNNKNDTLLMSGNQLIIKISNSQKNILDILEKKK